MVDMLRSYGSASNEDIKDFELKNGIVLHEQYKKFLIENNGGKANLPEISIGSWGITTVNTFYGLNLDNIHNLEDVLERIDHFPIDQAMPIADDPGGNIFLIGTDDSSFGKVYFWDHAEWPEDLEPIETLIEVASSFDDFVNLTQ